MAAARPRACWARLLAGRPRDSYVLATKLFGEMSDTDQGLSRAQIAQADRRLAEAAAGRLRRPLPVPPLRPRHAAGRDHGGADRGRARRARRATSASREWSPAQIEAAIAMTGVEQFVSSQPQYSLLWRRPEQKVIPLCAANGISQIVWSPLAQGVLSGKYAPGASRRPAPRATSDSMGGAMQNWLRPDILEAVQKLKPMAEEAGCTLSPVLAGLGAARAERRLGHRRREPPRAAGRERRRVGPGRSTRPCSPRPRRSSPGWSGRGSLTTALVPAGVEKIPRGIVRTRRRA